MDKNNQKENLVLIGAKIKKSVRETIETIASVEDRSVSQTVNRLLETHPEVQKKISESNQPLPIAA